MGAPEPGAELIANFLRFRGIDSLDAIIVSHADADHYNALPELLERFPARAAYVSPVMFRQTSAALERLATALARAKIPPQPLVAGDRLQTDDATCIEVLHPLPHGVAGSDNANSIVLLITYAGRRILLPGDLEPPGLQDVMAEMPLDCDILMAPHHGSPHSAPKEFARWCTPQWVVISGGRKASAGQITADLERQGCQVLHTGYDGAVIVVLDAKQLRVEPWFAD
jgi:competence protein ComEC